MLEPEYPLETARLTIRPFTLDDLDDLFAIHSRHDVARFLYWEARDIAQVREALGRKVRQTALREEGEGLALAVVWREAGRVVGEVTLTWHSQQNRQGEIGFIFNPDYQGKGLAREAAEVGLRLGFEGLGLHRVYGSCDARNLPSARLMERLGMRQEAHLVEHQIFKGDWDEELVYAMLEHEWRTGGR